MKDDRLYLLHISESLERIEEYVAEGREAFFADRKTQDAVLRNLQTLAESSQRLSSGRDPAVVPLVEQPLRGEDGQVLDEPVFPPLVLVGVADEDLGLRHFKELYPAAAIEGPGCL